MQSPVLDPRNNVFARHLFSSLPARYDLLAEVLSFGQNGEWRREMVGHLKAAPAPAAAAPAADLAPPAGTLATADRSDTAPAAPAPARPAVILDVAAGTAGVSLQIAQRTGARVIGLDLTREMLAEGSRRITAAGQSAAISLVNARAEQIPLPDASVDAVSFTYLLRYVADPQATLAELARVLKPGGNMASLEFHVPPSPFWRFWWHGYTRLLLPAGGLITGGRPWYDVGNFLGPSITGHYRRYPLDWTVRAWEQAGLHDVGYKVMSLGGGLVMWGTKVE